MRTGAGGVSLFERLLRKLLVTSWPGSLIERTYGREKPLNVLEKDFNASLRVALRSRGLKAIHIVEADSPGPADLIVYQGATILGWLELKMGDEPLRSSQIEFLRDHDKESGNAYVVRMFPNTGIITVERPKVRGYWNADAEWVILCRTADMHRFDWLQALVKMKRGAR